MHLRLFSWVVGVVVSGSLSVALAQGPSSPAPVDAGPPESEQQNAPGDDVENILEATLQKEEEKQAVKEEAVLNEPKRGAPPLTDLSGLANLAPFSDIAVIQKKFLPKTKRFEFFPGLGMVMNDAFFLNVGLNMRLAYFFSEYLGIEGAVHLIGTSEKQVTRDLSNNKGVVTRTLVSPQGYYGAAARWTPVYGKMGLLDTSIIPYDLYFLGGAGSTATNQGTNAITFHLGTGQTFAIKKWMAARWELSWFFYSAKTSTGQGAGNFTNLWATVGLAFYFPEAKYR